MNLLLPSPELPLRIIQMSLSEEENASAAEVNTSVSAAGPLSGDAGLGRFRAGP